MARGYDGTLKFDTKADLTGINRGIAAAGNQLKSIGKVLAGIGKVLAAGFLVALLAVVSLVGFLVSIGRKMFELAGVTKNAAGQVVGYGKKVEELKHTFANLKSALTDAFRPLILAAMPWINAVAQALTGILNMVAQVMASLTGQEGYWRTVTGAAEASGDATEKAEGALAAFDKINVLKEEDQGGGGGGGGGGAGQEWVPIGEEAAGIAEKIKEIWGKIVGFLAPVIDAIGRLKDAFVRLGEAVLPILKDIWEDIQPVFIWLRDIAIGIIDWVTKKINALAGWLEEHPDLWEEIKTAIADWWEGAKTPLTIVAALIIGIATALGLAALGLKAVAVVMAVVSAVQAAWNAVSAVTLTTFGWIVLGIGLLIAAVILLIVYWDEIKVWAIATWEKIKEVWATVAEWFKTSVIDPVVEFFFGVWEAVSGFFSDLWEKIKEIWNTVSDWFKTKVIDPIVNFFRPILTTLYIIFYDLWLLIKYVWEIVADWFKENVVDPVVEFFKEVWTNVSGFFSDLWEDIKEVWNVVSEWFKTNVVDPVKTWFEGVWTSVSTYFSNLWEDIKAVWETVSNWFQTNVIDPVVTAWDTATTKIGEFFTNMWDGVKDGAKIAINWVIEKINGFLSGIVGGINSLFEKWNSIPIPGWLSIPLIAVPQIPLLATGAVIPANSEFLALLGDQRSGRNIEAPEDLIRQIVREETRRNNQNTGDIMANLTVNLDGETIWQNQQRISKIHGKRLVTGGMA